MSELSDKDIERIAADNVSKQSEFSPNEDYFKKFYESKGMKPMTYPEKIYEEKDEKPVLPVIEKPRDEKMFKAPSNTDIFEETNSDLKIITETVPLPSKGIFYEHGISEVEVEYLTSEDEDILTTPSLLENSKALDIILKRKIKTKGIKVEELLLGDKHAIILFLRMSSYGDDYKVQVYDPRTDEPFEYTVDLRKIKYKDITEYPDTNGEFSLDLPIRKKNIKFRLLTAQQEKHIEQTADNMAKQYKTEYRLYSTLKLKASITEINGNREKDYINKFVDNMPAGDANAIRRKINNVKPDIDTIMEFTTHDGFTFKAPLSFGMDFFFPSL